MSFSFQSDILKAKVKWVILKIDRHCVLHQRAEKGSQTLSKFFFPMEEKSTTTFKNKSLTPVVRSETQATEA